MLNFQLLKERKVQKAFELVDLIEENKFNIPNKGISGIYAIFCYGNNKVYFGKAKCVLTRLKTHRSALLKSNHSNDSLQRAFNKYGCNSFTACLIQQAHEEDLKEAEGMYIKYFNSVKLGFNKRRENIK